MVTLRRKNSRISDEELRNLIDQKNKKILKNV